MLGNLFSQRRSQQPQASQQDAIVQQPEAFVQPAPSNQQQLGSAMDPAKRQDLSALSHLDQRATQVLMHAQNEAVRAKQEHIEVLHVFLGLLYDQDVYKLLEEVSVDVAGLSRDAQAKLQTDRFSGQPTFSNATTQLFEQSYRSARERDANFLTPEDLLFTLQKQDATIAHLLTAHGLKPGVLDDKLSQNNNFAFGKKSFTQKFGIDLTDQARKGLLDPIFGRDKELDRLVHILLRRTKNNPIIIGEAGVGKTAIVEGLAEKIVSGDVPKDLTNKRIVQLDMASLIAGASHRGEFEERLRSVINEAMSSNGNMILFIDEIHTLIGAGDTQGALDASNIIKPHLARGQLQLIGTTTIAEYRKHFEKDKAFERRFQPILAEEPDEETAVGMLKVLQAKYEKFHTVVFDEESLKASVHLSKKYIGERYLPDKAVDLLDEAAAHVKLEVSGGKRVDNHVKKADIERVVSAWTGIPITKLTEDESQKLLKLDELIHKRLIDQEEAVVAVAEAVRRGRIGLSSANRPIASFVFLGPTGVGKTELAKTLGELLFGREDAMVRLDMSEYMEKHEVAKLIGAPPGYVGYEEGGQLTEAVRAKPYSIVLLDEVEKAHPDVFNILLQLLEDGRLTDNKGNTISFKNTIIIATSNIGSSLIQQQLNKEFSTPENFNKEFEELSNLLMGELHKFFRPELLNRFDEVVIFKPLRPEHMAQIAKLGIEKTEKLLKEQGFGLSASQGSLDQLAKEGYDPVYGARPLRRLIQTAIENPIALLIISKTFVQGDTIQVDFDAAKNQFTFNKSSGQQVQPGAPVPPTSVPPPPQGNQVTQTPPVVQQASTTPQSPTTQPGENTNDIDHHNTLNGFANTNSTTH